MTTYAFKNDGNDTAKAYGSNLDISVKTSINICNKIRGLDAQKAIVLLARVQNKEEAIPFTRFTDGVGHRRGMASGRYPLKASAAISDIIKSAVANAANKGLAEELEIVHICAHKAGSPMHQGRQQRRAMKRTHIEVVLKESEVKAKPAKKKAEAKSKSKQVTQNTEKPKADVAPVVPKGSKSEEKKSKDKPESVKKTEEKSVAVEKSQSEKLDAAKPKVVEGSKEQ